MITDVTVFLKGAYITRNESFNLEKGINKLYFNDFPISLNPETLSVSSSEGSSIVSLDYSLSKINKFDDGTRISNLKLKIESIKDEIDFQKGMLLVCSEQEEVLKHNRRITGDNFPFDVKNLEAAMEFFRETMTKLCIEKIKINNKINKLNEELEQLKIEIGSLESSKDQHGIEVLVLCEEEGNFNLTLSYYIYDAGFTHLYDIKVADIDENVEFILKASIYQHSGEDWDDVNLTISSLKPSFNTNLPNISPWYLDFPEERVAVLEESVSLRKMSYGANFSKQENIIGYEYKLDEKISIKTSMSNKIVAIESHSLEAEFMYYCVRKLDKNVFLTATFKNLTDLNLLEGKANIFFKDKYVGKTFINLQNIDETFKISLGCDSDIVVTRTIGNKFRSKVLIKNNIKNTRSFTIKVMNLKDKSINLLLIDQIPVSANKAIAVEVLNISNGVLNKESGILNWNFKLEKGSSREFEVKYQVTYPENKTVKLE